MNKKALKSWRSINVTRGVGHFIKEKKIRLQVIQHVRAIKKNILINFQVSKF